MCNSRGHQQRSTHLIAPKLFFSGIQQQKNNNNNSFQIYTETHKRREYSREISVRTQDSIYSRRPPAQTNWLRGCVVLFKMGRRNFKQTFSFFNSQVQRDIRVAGACSTCCWTVGKATAAHRCRAVKRLKSSGILGCCWYLKFVLCLNIVWTLLLRRGDNIYSKKNGNRSTKKKQLRVILISSFSAAPYILSDVIVVGPPTRIRNVILCFASLNCYFFSSNVISRESSKFYMWCWLLLMSRVGRVMFPLFYSGWPIPSFLPSFLFIPWWRQCRFSYSLLPVVSPLSLCCATYTHTCTLCIVYSTWAIYLKNIDTNT